MKKINIHEKLFNILSRINKNKVSLLLMQAFSVGLDEDKYEAEIVDYLNVSGHSKDSIGYLSNKHIEECQKMGLDLYHNKNRNRIKPGRLIKKIFKAHFIDSIISNRDIEEFNNAYIAEVSSIVNFKVVTGEDIRKFYNKKNYCTEGPSGTLNSCMCEESKQSFLDIYVNNENISLLVAFGTTGKVIGRALIWYNCDIYRADRDAKPYLSDQILMDRIYYKHEWLVNKFKTYAKENNMWSRHVQRYDREYELEDPNWNFQNAFIKIPIKNINFQHYPFMDTICYPDYVNNFLSNSPNLVGTTRDYMLRATEGLPSFCWSSVERKILPNNTVVWSKFSKAYLSHSKSVYSSLSKDYFVTSDCILSKIGNYYITPDVETDKCVITGEIYEKSKMIYSEFNKGFIHITESVTTIDEGIIHKSQAHWSNIFKLYVSIKGSVRVGESNNDYLPIEIANKIDKNNLEHIVNYITKYNELLGEKTTTKKEEVIDKFVFEF